MQHPDEGTIHAWLDGELDAAESARIEALVASDAAWAAAAAEARGLIAASSRIARALDHVPGKVVPAGRRAPARRWWMARVAALLVVVAGTAIVWRRGTVPETIGDVAPKLQSARPAAPVSAPAPGAARALTNAPRVQATAKQPPVTRTLADRVPTPAPAAPPPAPASGKVMALQDSLADREPKLSVTTMATGALRADARGAAAVAHAACYRIIEPSGAGLASRGSRVLALDDFGTARPKAMEMRAAVPPAPATADVQRPLQGEIQGDRADTVIVTWRDGGQAFRVRAVTRGDSLVEARSAAPDSLAGAFRAVRVACPRP
jgi:anti-sigma factor RsiW